jgi:transglutaminase-like putative cysteine protease
MTVLADTQSGRSLGELVVRIPFRPAEGWLSLFAALMLPLSLAWSLENAAWTPGSPKDADFLSWMAVVGFAFGIGGAKVGWGRWRTHLVGSIFAGLILPLVVGGIVLSHLAGWDPHDIARRFASSAEVARNVWKDFVIDGRQVTRQWAHYHLVFGGIVWGAGMLAGFTVFGHRRPLDAVVVVGLLIIGNMVVFGGDQLFLMVIFTCAALLLLIRTHVFEEEIAWARRKIGDPAAVSQLYLTNGALFVAVAILSSFLLTNVASSAPLQGAWSDLPRMLTQLSQVIQRFAPGGGTPRDLGILTLGDNAITVGQWQPSDKVAFRAQFDRTEVEPFKWRLGAFAEYTLDGWKWAHTRTEVAGPNAVLLGNDVSGDKPTAENRRQVQFRVTTDAYVGKSILGPNVIQSVDRNTEAFVVGDNGWFATVESTDATNTYNVTALIPVFESREGGITEPLLRGAGTDYPEDIKEIYTAFPATSMGPYATALLDAIRAQVKAPSYADPSNPYDLARTMQDYLRDPNNFTYDEDIRDLIFEQCQGVSTVECFAMIRQGYCDPYASTMTILLRASGVPARVAYGFLGAKRDSNGLETVSARQAHYWVEVYFPNVGWIEFDPTGGVGQVTAIPSGSPTAATPQPSRTPGPTRPGQTPPSTFGPGGPGGPTNGEVGPFIAIALVLMVGIAGLVYAAYRRTPRRPMHPDKAWGSLASLARRFGLGPRPSQTVYEYAGALGDAVPAARFELTTIARGKVEVAYGKRDLEPDRMRRIAEAYHRLRFAILALAVRRGFRRPGRHR